MSDHLRKAIQRRFDLSLWPKNFIRGCALVAVKGRLNIDTVILAFIVGTSIFSGKSQIFLEGSDRVEVGSIWIVNVQVYFDYLLVSRYLSLFNLFFYCMCIFLLSGQRQRKVPVTYVSEVDRVGGDEGS